MTSPNRYRLVLAVARCLHALSHQLHRRDKKSRLSQWFSDLGDRVAWIAYR